MCNTSGQLIPFAGTKRARVLQGDPRLSIAERYRSSGADAGHPNRG